MNIPVETRPALCGIGWAAVPGNNSSERVSAVARACAALLLTST